MTEKQDLPDEEDNEIDEVFDRFSEVCDGYGLDSIVAACIDMIVGCTKESEDESFAKGVVAALLDAAQFLALTGAESESEEKSVIQLLN